MPGQIVDQLLRDGSVVCLIGRITEVSSRIAGDGSEIIKNAHFVFNLNQYYRLLFAVNFFYMTHQGGKCRTIRFG